MMLVATLFFVIFVEFHRVKCFVGRRVGVHLWRLPKIFCMEPPQVHLNGLTGSESLLSCGLELQCNIATVERFVEFVLKHSQKSAKRMPRSAVPSQAQQEMLLEFLEGKRWLATGYARTSHARDRTRAAWEEISLRLNSDRRGCIKSWQQWAKYWKDKKSAVKKKYSQIRMERQRTGGGAAEEIVLSPIEERIVELMGDRFAIGDRELEINPFHQSNNETDQPVAPVPVEIEEAVQLNVEEILPDLDATAASESTSQAYERTMAVEPGTSRSIYNDQAFGHSEAQIHSIVVMDVEHPGHSLQEPQRSSPIRQREGEPQQLRRGSQMTERASGTVRAREAPAAAGAASATSSPRRRRLARRRLVRRSPPAQRQSQLATLTDRFIAMEEQRIETEQMLAQSHRDFLAAFQKISEDFHELVEHIKRS